jgi:flagellar basal-body rod modification protein FlgD
MANLLIGSVTNGEYTKTNASKEATKSNDTTSTSKTAAKENGGYSEEMFLQLLVAEMQYQDPLQPTDNSQYVSQLASFSQIEAVQAVQNNMETIQANSIVGKYAALTVNGQEVSGRVDYVTKNDEGKLQVSINDELYDMDAIESVVDGEFYAARYMASLFITAIDKLPEAEQVTKLDGEKIQAATNQYKAMSDYALSYVDEKRIKKYLDVVAQYEKLTKPKEEADKTNETSTTNTTEASNTTTPTTGA